MNKSILVILASARKESDTKTLVYRVFADQEYTLLDLLDYTIAPYNYEHHYPAEDKFLTLIEQVLQHDIIVFATPVYWYAMSGLLKTFFDRLTDISTIHKMVGRQLNGRITGLLAVGSDQELPPGFAVPFELTSSYLHMEFRGALYSSQKYPDTEAAFKGKSENFLANLFGYHKM